MIWSEKEGDTRKEERLFWRKTFQKVKFSKIGYLIQKLGMKEIICGLCCLFSFFSNGKVKIWTWIVGLEGKHGDHWTTTTVKIGDVVINSFRSYFSWKLFFYFFAPLCLAVMNLKSILFSYWLQKILCRERLQILNEFPSFQDIVIYILVPPSGLCYTLINIAHGAILCCKWRLRHVLIGPSGKLLGSWNTQP